jgi:hypothetical protein
MPASPLPHPARRGAQPQGRRWRAHDPVSVRRSSTLGHGTGEPTAIAFAWSSSTPRCGAGVCPQPGIPHGGALRQPCRGARPWEAASASSWAAAPASTRRSSVPGLAPACPRPQPLRWEVDTRGCAGVPAASASARGSSVYSRPRHGEL